VTRRQPERAFFDDPAVRTALRRERKSDPVHVMEEPALLEVLGEPRGLRILDLGCGEAALGRSLLAAGARSYRGIDSSARARGAARHGGRGRAGDDRVVRRLARQRRPRRLAPRAALCRRPRAGAGGLPRLPGAGRADRVQRDAPGDHLARRPREHRRAAHQLARRRLLRRWAARAGLARRADDVASPQGRGLRGGAPRRRLRADRAARPVADRFGGDDAEFARRNRIPLFLVLAGALSA
jgi:hypothetical protein